MNTIKATLIAILSLFALSSAAQWAEVEWDETDGISNIDFVDDVTGYAQMQLLQGFTSSFEKTLDGGQTWTEMNVPVTPSDIQDMDFLSSGVGVLVTRSYIDGEILTQVYKTTDDGANWEDISPEEAATGFGMSEIQMLDANTVFFVIDNYFYRTVNGGADWNIALLPAAPVSVHFADADHGVVGTWDATFNYFGGMMSTTDGGATWNETALEINSSVIGVVQQFNQTTAVAAPVKWGANGLSHFYKTTDNGLNWTIIPVPETDDNATLTGLQFRNEDFGVITLTSNTQFHIYHTADGGATWELQNELEALYTTDMDLTPSSGYISGEGGKMLRLDGTLGLTELNELGLTLYPNPATSGQLIQWNGSAKYTQINIVDCSGKTVFQENLVVQNTRLPKLSSGVYFVSLHNELTPKTIKLMVH